MLKSGFGKSPNEIPQSPSLRMPSIDDSPKHNFTPGVTRAFLAVLFLVLLAYANHFNNSFHFDDSHTISSNPWIRDIANIPRFFTDADTFSSLPANRTYRPLVSTTLAIDYRLGNGTPPWFHISTFFWFLVQLTVMFLLFRMLLDRWQPGPRNAWVALFASALYGLHPAIAETVNYIIQRGDLYSTLGVVASLALYFGLPRWRGLGIYLIPFAAAMLSKPPALVMPVLLFTALVLLEGQDWKVALKNCLPSVVAMAALGWFTAHMTPASYSGGGTSAFIYRMTQPVVLLHYASTFFLPTGLTADTDRAGVTSLLQGDALLGLLFIGALLAAICACTKRRQLRPIAFGLCWFLITSLPTSLFPLAEVENDHRMFFPFVGLALSVSYAAALAVERWKLSRQTTVVCSAIVLLAFAWGVRERNKVWLTEESLWADVSVKSPRNGRGLMNYGLTQMARGNYAVALNLFERALVLTPNYYVLEINLGVDTAAMGRAAEAERHFLRAIALAPADASAEFFYARWLRDTGRTAEAMAHLKSAVIENADYVDARYLLMQCYADIGDTASLRTEAADTLARFPSDKTAAMWLQRGQSTPVVLAKATTPVPSAAQATADTLINESLRHFQLKQYPECISSARSAIALQANLPTAWNNIGACYNAMADWDNGIKAEQQALRLQPDFQLARNNLAWALDEKAKLAAKGSK